MRNLKYKILVILLCLIGCSLSLIAQNIKVQRDEAWKIVQKEVLTNTLKDLSIYASKAVLPANTKLKSIFTEVAFFDFKQ